MKITTGLFCVSLAVGATDISGCASQPKLTHEQALSQYQQVERLDSGLQKARTENAELLAPTSYAKASSSLKKAMLAAQNNKAEAANEAATEGLKSLDKLNRDAQSSRELLAEVLQVRDRAYAADAKALQGDKILDLDEQLIETSELVEKGDLEKAKQIRPKLIDEYAKLELVALKQGTVEKAKSAIVNAKKQGAERHAPKTLTQAEEEIALTVSILNADRTQTEKADQHANKAKWLAEQSASITETIKDFDRRDYSMEDVVLWQQQQLAIANQPLGGTLPFNEPSDKAALSLKSAVANLLSEKEAQQQQLQAAAEKDQQSQAQLQAAEEKIAALTSGNQAEMAKQQSSSKAQLTAREAELAKQLSTRDAELANQLSAREAEMAKQLSANEAEKERLRLEFEAQLAQTEKDKLALQEKDEAEQQKFENIQAMFSEEEATVYRQLQNVLISAHGFSFPSGQSEIQADNFPLMNKIVDAIKTFPNARIEVGGHTDSSGSDAANQKLSEARAAKVAKFLKEVGGIAADRVSSRGFGEAKPVASNETREGRAENRRVDIKIVN